MSESKLTLRLRNVANKAPNENILVQHIRDAARVLANISAEESQSLSVTLAPNAGTKYTATIQYRERKDLKAAVLGCHSSIKHRINISWEDHDTHFRDLTVLHAPTDVEVDICAVHGLNGNSFDTWVAKNGTMWLRDLLPKTGEFKKCRIMLFGYTSALRDKKKANDRLKDYSSSLLKELQSVRRTDAEKTRPLIFICHSMGGLVSRLAMTLLYTRSQEYHGICLGLCGLLFLSTPHFGSQIADWNEFWVQLARAVGVRSDLVKELQSLNSSVVDITVLWGAMNPTRPFFKCLCEAEETRVARITSRTIVPQGSAGFLDESAEKVLGTDHRSICKFQHSLETGYKRAEECLLKIRRELLSRLSSGIVISSAQSCNIIAPGRPPIVAKKTPFTTNQAFYLGSDLGYREPSGLIGRGELVVAIEEALEADPSSRSFVCLSGMGGIGKTEIIYEIAGRLKGRRPIFMFDASSIEALDSSYNTMLLELGHDILQWKYPLQHQAYKLWTESTHQDQLALFRQWLVSNDNKGGIIIFDDIDGLKNDAAIRSALPRNIPRLIYSSRDPTLAKSLLLKARHITVPDLNCFDVTMLIQRELSANKLEASEDELLEIARITHGHPLTICRAISYMTQLQHEQSCYNIERRSAKAFIDLFKETKSESRKSFLETEVHFGDSIMKSFERSLDRMGDTNAAKVLVLLEIIAFLSPPLGIEGPSNFRDFFIVRPWLSNHSAELPDCNLLTTGLEGKGAIFRIMENVSLLVGRRPESGSEVHPIWLECTRYRCERQRIVYWLRQLVLICFLDTQQVTPIETSTLFLRNIQAHATLFSIAVEEISSSCVDATWIRTHTGF